MLGRLGPPILFYSFFSPHTSLCAAYNPTPISIVVCSAHPELTPALSKYSYVAAALSRRSGSQPLPLAAVDTYMSLPPAANQQFAPAAHAMPYHADLLACLLQDHPSILLSRTTMPDGLPRLLLVPPQKCRIARFQTTARRLPCMDAKAEAQAQQC